jgi:hypothetical protein
MNIELQIIIGQMGSSLPLNWYIISMLMPATRKLLSNSISLKKDPVDCSACPMCTKISNMSLPFNSLNYKIKKIKYLLISANLKNIFNK